nr:MAG TPA: hypothetical protein [Caudoviricetes sp.]
MLDRAHDVRFLLDARNGIMEDFSRCNKKVIES